MKLQAETIGPYRIVEPLGRGGMGVVYRAVDPGGRSVALKTVRLAQSGLLQSIRREIHALARIRHPGIVHILDTGVEEGLPWYAMELIESLPLSQYCMSRFGSRTAAALLTTLEMGAGASPETTEVRATPQQWWTYALISKLAPEDRPSVGEAEPQEERSGHETAVIEPKLLAVLTLVRRLCAALGFLHGEGIVHRDLKPDNVLVRPDGMPVLVDFGLAARFAGRLSREELEVEAAAAGTVAYMAPEQGRGQFVDARADLYSLGCILYELITGRPPFVGESPIQVLWQHFEAEPRAPSKLVDGVPPQLDALVLRLLAKEPRERFGHAGDLATALAELGAQDGLAAAGPKPRAYLYRPGFSGRHGVLRQLEQTLLGLRSGAGAVILIGGESGVGKTRLLMELGRRATKVEATLLTGECLDAGAQPLEALRKPLQSIADRCRAGGTQHTERILGLRGKPLAQYEPALAGLPGQEIHPEPAELSSGAARLRLYSYLYETLLALTGGKPLLLLLDDLQWADDLTLGFVDFVRRAVQLGRRPLLVVGAYRSEEAGPGLRSLLEAAGVQSHALGRLDEAAVSAMVGDMLALEPAPALFVRYLTRHSEGNPFFIAEYLRTAVEERLLYRDERGRWHVAEPVARKATEADYETLPMPDSLRELARRRLQGLPQAAQVLVDAAAVLGREADTSLVWQMTQLGDEPLLEALDELLRRQILEMPAPGQTRFTHDKLRETAYERIEGSRRAELHRAAAEAIELRFAEKRDEHLAALGLHWEQAGETEKARACYLEGARRATERYAHEEAERLYRGYLRLVEQPDAESIAVRNELGEKVLRLQGRNDEALREHERSLSEARRIGSRALEGDSLRGLGLVCRILGRPDEAAQHLEQALDIFRQLGIARAEGIVLANLALLHFERGRPEKARTLYLEALDLHRQVGDLRSEGMVLGNLATLHHQQGRLDEARALYLQALHLHRQIGDRTAEGMLLGNLGILHHHQGRLEEARAFHLQALAIHRQVGDRRNEAIVLGNLANLLNGQKRLDEAQALYLEALAIGRQIGERRFEGMVLLNLAQTQMERGRLEESHAICLQGLAIGRQVGDRRMEGAASRALADLELLKGDLERADALAGEAERLLMSVGDKLALGGLLCLRGRIALCAGTAGRPFLERAQALASEVGVGPDSQLHRLISTLERAVTAFEAGEQQRLFRGQCLEDIPAGVRRWLVETGQLEASS
jgi:serine/threonine protein kinase/predicted ATPase